MGWLDTTSLNQRCTVKEGNYLSWRIGVSSDTWVNLSVYRIDGYGPNLYVIPANEFQNYKDGLTFKIISSLSFENIEEFSRRELLGRGSYYIVVSLPSIPDDRDSISQFNIRYEVVR